MDREMRYRIEDLKEKDTERNLSRPFSVFIGEGRMSDMKKAFAVLFSLLLIALAGCSSDVLKKPETDLEFWIAENVDDVDFSGYEPKYGIMGGREYYGKGYVPTVNEDGMQTDPDKCVIYTVTAYPDYSSGSSHITRIMITDPAVSVYGLSVDSPREEIESVMKKNGFSTKDTGSSAVLAFAKGKYSFLFYDGKMVISVEVTNKEGIMF